jgi:transglutaminase-like putative cysteine protease
MLVHYTFTKIPEIDNVKVADLATKLNNDIYLLRLSYPEIEKQIEVVKILKAIDSSDKSIIEIAQQCKYVFTNFTYTKGITNIETTLDEILEHRKGVCQDLHLSYYNFLEPLVFHLDT